MKPVPVNGRGLAFVALMVGCSALVMAAMSYSYFEGAQAGRVELEAVSSKAMATILKRMASKKIEKQTTTEKLQDQILKEKNRIAELKLKSSQTFAQWEKQDELATSAKTKATSLHEIYQQDRARQRMLNRKLETLTAKLTKHLSKPTATEAAVKGKKGAHMTGSAARSELSSYFNKLAKATGKKSASEKQHHKKPQTHKAKGIAARAPQPKAAVHKGLVHKKQTIKHAAVQKQAKHTAALRQVPNVWDKATADNFSTVYHAQHNLKKLSMEADKQIAAQAAKLTKKI